VLYIVLDDVGFSAMEPWGGLIDTPNIKKLAARGLTYTNWHTTALCSPTRSSLLNGRDHTTNGMACIAEATTGFPNSNGHIPFECATIAEVLGERGWNTYMLGKWHLVAADEMKHGLDEAKLARRPRLRALLRVPRRRDEPVVSGPGVRQPSS
jgi:arylsulfatase